MYEEYNWLLCSSRKIPKYSSNPLNMGKFGSNEGVMMSETHEKYFEVQILGIWYNLSDFDSKCHEINNFGQKMPKFGFFASFLPFFNFSGAMC